MFSHQEGIRPETWLRSAVGASFIFGLLSSAGGIELGRLVVSLMVLIVILAVMSICCGVREKTAFLHAVGCALVFVGGAIAPHLYKSF